MLKLRKCKEKFIKNDNIRKVSMEIERKNKVLRDLAFEGKNLLESGLGARPFKGRQSSVDPEKRLTYTSLFRVSALKMKPR